MWDHLLPDEPREEPPRKTAKKVRFAAPSTDAEDEQPDTWEQMRLEWLEDKAIERQDTPAAATATKTAAAAAPAIESSGGQAPAGQQLEQEEQQRTEPNNGAGKKPKLMDSGSSRSGTAPATSPSINVPIHEVIHRFAYGGSDSEGEPPYADQTTSHDDLAWWSEVELQMSEHDLSEVAFLRAPTFTSIDPEANLPPARQLADPSSAFRRRIVGKRPARKEAEARLGGGSSRKTGRQGHVSHACPF